MVVSPIVLLSSVITFFFPLLFSRLQKYFVFRSPPSIHLVLALICAPLSLSSWIISIFCLAFSRFSWAVWSLGLMINSLSASETCILHWRRWFLFGFESLFSNSGPKCCISTLHSSHVSVSEQLLSQPFITVSSLSFIILIKERFFNRLLLNFQYSGPLWNVWSLSSFTTALWSEAGIVTWLHNTHELNAGNRAERVICCLW